MKTEPSERDLPFLTGGGEMGELIRTKDWAATLIGTPDTWPVMLKQLIAQMLVNPFPILICWGNDYIQFYNDAFRPINGATKHPQALGGSAKDTYAEIWETIGPMFAGVMQGQAVSFPNFMVQLDRNGYVEDCYFDFSYSPIKDENGDIHGVQVICVEVTAQIVARKKLEEYNEEIGVANEELRAANDEASEAQKELQNLFRELEISETKYRNEKDRLGRFFMQAPAGICILDGPEMRFELVNPFYQQLFPGRQLFGNPLLEAVPEVKGAPILDILNDVYHTGKTFEGKALLIPLARTDTGPVEDRYFDFIYQARLDEQGKVDGILVFVIEVTRDISSQKEAQETSARLFEQIKALNDKKDEFIGLASHELKTPLTSISGYLQILSRIYEDQKSKHFVDKTLLQLNKLTALVNDLLDVSKIEAGKLRFSMTLFDLKIVVEDAIEMMQHSTNKHVISLNSAVETCQVTADSQRIEQVLINLLNNAIKYSPKAEKVEVSLTCTDTEATVSIRDFGMGIPQDKLENVFDRFYRVDDASPNISGLGIGLYLSHEIIDRHKGRLWAESKSGEGSTFHFKLPLTHSVKN